MPDDRNPSQAARAGPPSRRASIGLDTGSAGHDTSRSWVAGDESGGPVSVRHDLVVVANRLPVRSDESGQWTLSPGGLVTAMAAVMDGRHGAWIGWAGADGGPTDPFAHGDMTLRPVTLTSEEHRGYYEGFSNGTLWPLYHNGLLPTTIKRSWWNAYRQVNERFAAEAIDSLAPGAVLWVHDYHLQLVPALVRDARPDVRTGFFLHTPFPPSQLIMRLPWRSEIAEGILSADVVGFQTATDARNFLALAHRVADVPEVRFEGRSVTIERRGRDVQVAAHPISIDVAGVEEQAHRCARAGEPARFRATIGGPAKMILGVDRLDYTKGIDARLKAFRELLKDGELDPEEVVFVQVATPSRDDVPGYAETRATIEQLVGEINGDYSPLGRPVVHFLRQTLTFEALLPLYMSADVMAVTPFEDGMNLVAKEFVASRIDERGVLLLSEFAGAAAEFDDAVLCNPFDTTGLKRRLHAALHLDPAEQGVRMAALRQTLRRHDVHDWARAFLDDLA